MSSGASERDRSWGGVGLSLITCGLLLALVTRIGADLLWLVALGDDVRRTGALPAGVPFAAAPSDGWPPVLVAAEVALSLIHELGLAAVLIWHFLVVIVALVLVAIDGRRQGVTDKAMALTLGVLLIGGAATFGVARLQTFSLIFFAMTLLLVRAQYRDPSRRMWCAPLIVAVWGNLHGSVLLGVCVIGAYLLFSRLPRRRVETIALGVATLGALFLNPATWRTPHYYLGVVENEAAARGEGMWAAPSPANPFDLLMIVAIVALGGLALRRRLPLWEYVAVLGLTIVTVIAARNGIWLLLFLAALPAMGHRRPVSVPGHVGRPSVHVTACVVAGLLVCASVLGYRAQAMTEVEQDLAREVLQAAPGLIVLAPEPVVESLAAEGVRVWLSNPLDAFSAEHQGAYLDFMAGRSGMSVAVDASDAVLVLDGSSADEVMARFGGFDARPLVSSWTLYIRD